MQPSRKLSLSASRCFATTRRSSFTMEIFSCLSLTSERRYFPILLRELGGVVDWICTVPRNASMWKSIGRNFDRTLISFFLDILLQNFIKLFLLLKQFVKSNTVSNSSRVITDKLLNRRGQLRLQFKSNRIRLHRSKESHSYVIWHTCTSRFSISLVTFTDICRKHTLDIFFQSLCFYLFSRLYNVSTSSCAHLTIILSSSSSCLCHSSLLPLIPFLPSVL